MRSKEMNAPTPEAFNCFLGKQVQKEQLSTKMNAERNSGRAYLFSV
jgi:hypothetical protein